MANCPPDTSEVFDSFRCILVVFYVSSRRGVECCYCSFTTSCRHGIADAFFPAECLSDDSVTQINSQYLTDGNGNNC